LGSLYHTGQEMGGRPLVWGSRGGPPIPPLAPTSHDSGHLPHQYNPHPSHQQHHQQYQHPGYPMQHQSPHHQAPLLIMATNLTTHMEDTMDMKVVKVHKHDVSLSSDRNVCFWQWQLIKIACPIDSATSDQRWWKSSLPLRKMYQHDTQKEPRS
jgi:hypothetical protein